MSADSGSFLSQFAWEEKFAVAGEVFPCLRSHDADEKCAAIRLLASLFRSPSARGWERESSVVVYASLVVSKLVEALDDSDQCVRRESVRVLNQFALDRMFSSDNGATAAPVAACLLNMATEDSDAGVRRLSLVALQSLCRNSEELANEMRQAGVFNSAQLAASDHGVFAAEAAAEGASRAAEPVARP